jgi:putative membrane protein
MFKFLPFLSTTFIVISAIFVAIGWVLIAQRKIQAHKKAMTLAGVFATLFFIFYLSRTVLLGNTLFDGPDSVKTWYLIFLLFHITLATVGGVMGIITLRWGYKNQLDKHRKIGPWTSVIWFATAITGVTVYYLLYIKYPGGSTVPVWKAIFG